MKTICGNHFVNTLTTLTALLINIWILLAPSGASRYLHMVLCSCRPPVWFGQQMCSRGRGQLMAGGVGETLAEVAPGALAAPTKSWNHRNAREGAKVSHAEMHRAGGSMPSAFPLSVSPCWAHTRPEWLFLASPCPHPSSSHGMMSTQLMHNSSTRLVLQLLWQPSTMPGYF